MKDEWEKITTFFYGIKMGVRVLVTPQSEMNFIVVFNWELQLERYLVKCKSRTSSIGRDRNRPYNQPH